MVAGGARGNRTNVLAELSTPGTRCNPKRHPERVPDRGPRTSTTASRRRESSPRRKNTILIGLVRPRSGTAFGVPFLGTTFSGGTSPASRPDLLEARTPGYHLRLLRRRRRTRSIRTRLPAAGRQEKAALRQSLYPLFVRGARGAVHRRRVVVLSHQSLPPLGTSALEDTACMTGRYP